MNNDFTRTVNQLLGYVASEAARGRLLGIQVTQLTQQLKAIEKAHEAGVSVALQIAGLK